MIYVIDRHNRDQYSGYLMQMHRQRYEYFYKVRGWEALDSWFELEVDEYDNLAATYIMVVDEGRVLASVRVMSTYYGTLMGEKFAQYITDERYPDYFGIFTWEMYRLLVVDSEWQNENGHKAIRMLWIAMLEYLRDQGAKRVLAVSDSSLLKRIPPTIDHTEIGERHIFPQINAGAGECALVELEFNQRTIEKTRKALGYTGGQYKSAEDGLEPAPTAIMPEQIYIVNRWLSGNHDKIRMARELLAESENSARSAKAFKELVTTAVQSSIGSTGDEPPQSGSLRTWH